MSDLVPPPTRFFERDELLCAGHAAEEVIGTLAAEVAELIGMSELAGSISNSALEREREESTYVGSGLAVPHARLPRLEQAVVYVARCAEGLPWPEEKAYLVSLLVVPEDQPGLHLQLLSHIARARSRGKL